jgi:hypothetical protein
MLMDWIPVATWIRRDPRVLGVARESSRSIHEVIGLLIDLEIFLLDRSLERGQKALTTEDLVAAVGADPAFWEALDKAGLIRAQVAPCAGARLRRKIRSRDRKRRERARKRRPGEGGGRGEAPAASGSRRAGSKGAGQKARGSKGSGRRRGAPSAAGPEGRQGRARTVPKKASSAAKEPPAAPGPRQSVDVPVELADLALYREDRLLARRWPDLLAAWRVAYPGLEIILEVRRAHAWEVENPTRRKRNRPRFLGRWLARSQDRLREVIGPAAGDPLARGAGGGYGPSVGRARSPAVENGIGRRSSFRNQEEKFSDARFK